MTDPSEVGANAPDEAPSAEGRRDSRDSAPARPTATDTVAVYLAKRLIGEKRFALGVPEEAAKLAEHFDTVLSHAAFGLAIACVVDRETDGARRFLPSKQDLLDIGRACLKYTGTINGTKLPVGIYVYEVSAGPPTAEDLQRLKALQRSVPGLQKVAVYCFHIDTRNKAVWSGAPLPGLLGRFGHRSWVESVVREPRKGDGEIFVPDAALPEKARRPVATAGLLAFLLGMFVVEQFAKGSRQDSGLLGVDVETLFSLGGMNRDAVLKSGEWYRLLTAALLHGDAFHILFNGLALGLAGYLLESMVGRAWLVTLFFVGALGGSLMGLALNPENMVSVGASGAVMALLAAALVVASRFPPGPRKLQMQTQILQFLIPSLIPLATRRPTPCSPDSGRAP
jgi:rhomboid protease GluP